MQFWIYAKTLVTPKVTFLFSYDVVMQFSKKVNYLEYIFI